MKYHQYPSFFAECSQELKGVVNLHQMTIMIMIVNHHNHDYHCHYQHRRSTLSKYGLMTSQINELWLGIGKPIIYHSADHKMMLM